MILMVRDVVLRGLTEQPHIVIALCLVAGWYLWQLWRRRRMLQRIAALPVPTAADIATYEAKCRRQERAAAERLVADLMASPAFRRGALRLAHGLCPTCDGPLGEPPGCHAAQVEPEPTPDADRIDGWYRGAVLPRPTPKAGT